MKKNCQGRLDFESNKAKKMTVGSVAYYHQLLLFDALYSVGGYID